MKRAASNFQNRVAPPGRLHRSHWSCLQFLCLLHHTGGQAGSDAGRAARSGLGAVDAALASGAARFCTSALYSCAHTAFKCYKPEGGDQDDISWILFPVQTAPKGRGLLRRLGSRRVLLCLATAVLLLLGAALLPRLRRLGGGGELGGGLRGGVGSNGTLQSSGSGAAALDECLLGGRAAKREGLFLFIGKCLFSRHQLGIAMTTSSAGYCQFAKYQAVSMLPFCS